MASASVNVPVTAAIYNKGTMIVLYRSPDLIKLKQFSVFFPLYESMKYKWPPGMGHFLPQGYNLNNLCRGPLDDATCILNIF